MWILKTCHPLWEQMQTTNSAKGRADQCTSFFRPVSQIQVCVSIPPVLHGMYFNSQNWQSNSSLCLRPTSIAWHVLQSSKLSDRCVSVPPVLQCMLATSGLARMERSKNVVTKNMDMLCVCLHKVDVLIHKGRSLLTKSAEKLRDWDTDVNRNTLIHIKNMWLTSSAEDIQQDCRVYNTRIIYMQLISSTRQRWQERRVYITRMTYM